MCVYLYLCPNLFQYHRIRVMYDRICVMYTCLPWHRSAGLCCFTTCLLLHPGTTVAQLLPRWEVFGHWCAQTASRFTSVGCCGLGNYAQTLAVPSLDWRWLHPAFLACSTRPTFSGSTAVAAVSCCVQPPGRLLSAFSSMQGNLTK